MHSSKILGAVLLVFVRPFKKRIKSSTRYELAVQYAVTLGNFALSSLPSRAASLRAVGSLMRVNWLYTSRPLSSSGPSSTFSGFGRSFSFCAVRVVRCGPILLAGCWGGSCNAAPELFRLRSLLLREERIGCEPSRAGIMPGRLAEEKDCDGLGNPGRRLGGLAVET